MKFLKKLFIFLILAVIVLISIVTLSGYSVYKDKIEENPISKLVSEKEAGEKYIKIDEVPKYYIDAVVAVEDHRFYSHGAVDYIAILRAIVRNITNKKMLEGGSTITQQVANNLYFINEDSDSPLLRKIAEIFISNDLEKEYGKDKILEIYINSIYFGEGYYGIKEACNGYFDKEPIDMTLDEATMLAGIPNAPSVYNPVANIDLAKDRQGKVISSMVEYGYLSQEEADNIKE